MRVLLVEDDTKINAIVRQALQEEAYAVDSACDSEQAEELVFVNPYDLLVVDIMLPGKDGLDFCRSLRAEGNSTPILFLTARDSLRDRVEGLDCGADDYLVKPFHLEELLARVRALLRRGSSSKSPRLVAADLVLDTAARRLAKSGQPIELTHTEYSMLEYLMRHAGEVVGRGELIDHVWDEAYDGLSNIVDVYIRRLRAKLGDDGEDRTLETVRGAGYRLRDPQHEELPA